MRRGGATSHHRTNDDGARDQKTQKTNKLLSALSQCWKRDVRKMNSQHPAVAVIVAPRCAALPPSSYNDHDDNLTLVDIANEQLERNKDEKVPSSQSPQEAKEEKQRIKGWSNTPTQYIPKNARPKNWDVPHFLSSKPLENNNRLPKTRAVPSKKAAIQNNHRRLPPPRYESYQCYVNYQPQQQHR